LSYIFINKDEYENDKIEEELFTHELTHVTQKHTLDVLIIEVLQAVFWINPLFILLKKAIQLNHEFLADETVINQHKNTTQYQHLLLNKAAWNNEYYLASNLNYSLTKKRLEMMTTQSSQTKIWLKKLAVVPLLTGFIFLFAETVEAQEIIEEEPIETIVEEVSNESEKLSESEIYKEYFHSKGHFIFKDKNGKKISKKYNELSKEEKKRMIPPPPLKSKKKIPTQELIEKLKDGEKYAIWINEKVVKNEVLNNYKSSDFASHFVSFVYKNARSKRFPQNYQAHLSTNKYFKAQNEKNVKDFEEYLKKEYKVEEVIETPKKNKTIYIDSPIKKQNSKQSISYNTYIKLEDLNELVQKVKYLNNDLTAIRVIENRTSMDAINYSYIIKNNGRSEIKSSDYDVIFLANNKEIKFRKNLPNLKPNETFINTSGYTFYYKEGRDKNGDFKPQPNLTKVTYQLKIVYKDDDVNNNLIAGVSELNFHKTKLSKYNLRNKQYESFRNKKPHFIESSKEKQKELKTMFSLLGTLYFKLSKEDKRKTKRPIHPHHPYVRLMKNNKVFYKLRKDLTAKDKLLFPPPPPMSKASKEEKIKYEKAYEAWQKRTGNDFAPPPPKDETIKILINKKGGLFIKGKPITISNLENVLKNLSIDKKKTNVIIYTDMNTKSSDIKKVKEILRDNKFSKINVNDIPPPPRNN
jgi:biopolymer transport protein ExbD